MENHRTISEIANSRGRYSSYASQHLTTRRTKGFVKGISSRQSLHRISLLEPIETIFTQSAIKWMSESS